MMEPILDHLGDGVYVKHDGFGITVMANDHQNPTDTVYMEPSVLEAFDRFRARCKAIMEAKEEG